ncbi:MAG: hypothetical protein CL607_20435 [Anaerolineaceae bacterium]|nr:hypothetical protein [Anaerolineaceae bacterium]
MQKQFSIILLLILTLWAIPLQAQTDADTCESEFLGDTLHEYANEIADATYEQILTLTDEINTLIDNYITTCSGSVDNNETEDTFNIKTTGRVNIRSCSDASCDLVMTSSAGQVFAVVGEDGDWYEIEIGNGETAFIASWLTEPGPDELINIYEGYVDDAMTCGTQATVGRSTSSGIDIAIAGSGRNEVIVDIYRPNTNNPETVWRQYDKTFVDTGDPYIHQVYRSSYWPLGTYQISLERGGIQRLLAFNLQETGETTIYVFCE